MGVLSRSLSMPIERTPAGCASLQSDRLFSHSSEPTSGGFQWSRARGSRWAACFALLPRKLCAFPIAIAVFAAFGIYQMYRYFVQPSGWLIAPTVLDVVVIFVTWVQWRRVQRRRPSVINGRRRASQPL